MDLSPIISKKTVASAGETGSWRNYRPAVIAELCSKCRNCVLYCPEGVISVGESSVEIDYRFCKGCGICKEVCEQRAIEMVPE